MISVMKKEHAFLASVCLLLSIVPELLNALPEEDDEYEKTTVLEQPPMKPKHTFCSMQVEDGPCKAMIRNYFFNILTHQCEEFIYGGCRGNKNRFDTLEECKETCIIGFRTFIPSAGLQSTRMYFFWTIWFLNLFSCDICGKKMVGKSGHNMYKN